MVIATIAGSSGSSRRAASPLVEPAVPAASVVAPQPLASTRVAPTPTDAAQSPPDDHRHHCGDLNELRIAA
eukprot:12428504-Alexandrium_andersonii.AAC.1